MAVEGVIKEKKKKKKIKQVEVGATAKNGGTTKYQHASVQKIIKTSEVNIFEEEQHRCDAAEKKKKKKIKEVGATAKDGATTKYQHASVQTTIKTEKSEVNICDAAEKKKKKKKTKEEKVEAGELVAMYHDVSVQTDVKTEPLEINITKGGQEKSDVPQKKKKKLKKESEHLQENVVKVNNSECLEKSKIKKVKKKRDIQIEASIKEAGEIKKKKKKDIEVTEDIDVGIIDTKKKKKKRKNIEEEEQKTELDDGEVKKKRKKAKAVVNEERVDKQTEKKKKKIKNTSLKTQNNDECVNGDKDTKVKIKKKKTAPVEEKIHEININTEKKTKKKKKRLENLDEGQPECPAHVNGTKAKTGDVIGEMMSSNHKKRKKIKLEVDDVTEMMEEELHEKKSKQDKNKPTEKSDVVFLSVKTGNQDEVSIDQARRLALQRDIDKESQPEPSLGQWSTAQFDSSDRQAKFLRLMGGFKKSSQPITGGLGQSNMALGKDGQQTLQQGLLGEFERAQSRHLDLKNKGIGLGFTPPSNKKFAIDVNARNSIRFDD